MRNTWLPIAALTVGILVGGAAALLLFGGGTEQGMVRRAGTKGPTSARLPEQSGSLEEPETPESAAADSTVTETQSPQATAAAAPREPVAPSATAPDVGTGKSDLPQAPQCPVCPEPNEVCKPHTEQVRELKQEVESLKKQVAKARQLAKGPGYEGPTSADRRFQAAKDDNLFLDFPAWSDGFELTAATVEKYGLTPEEEELLEQLYKEFTQNLEGKLRELLVELTGDVNAGADSTINALLHNVLQLSPQGACRERMLVTLQLIVARRPLPPPGPDAAACEVAVYFLYMLVDQLEANVLARLGEKGLKALWSGTSSFTFSAQGQQ